MKTIEQILDDCDKTLGLDFTFRIKDHIEEREWRDAFYLLLGKICELSPKQELKGE